MKSPSVFLNGFSLMELMTLLSISAILISLVRPSMQDFIDTVRVVTAANQLYSAIGLTRS